MSKEQVLAITENRNALTYRSIRAASRVLSGTGEDGKRSTIARRLAEGGGYVNGVYVQRSTFRG